MLLTVGQPAILESGKFKPGNRRRKEVKLPLQITTRNVSLSPAAEENIREKASKLDSISERIMSCRVLVEAPHRHQTHGILYNVRIDLTVPGKELVVKREANQDLYVAIRDAFDAARRQLQQHFRKQRGDIKLHEEPPCARIGQLFSTQGYGFIDTLDGRQIYFHRNSLANGDFEALEIGTMVRFSEEAGDNGPQASSVKIMSAVKA